MTVTSHHCQPPTVDAERWTCAGCGRTWVAHGHGWRAAPAFVAMASAVGEVDVRLLGDHERRLLGDQDLRSFGDHPPA